MEKIDIDIDMEKFAIDWINELLCNLDLVKSAYNSKDESWQKSVDFAIELRAWRECFRKVSQLCHYIGGNALEKFETNFPNGLETYKTRM